MTHHMVSYNLKEEYMKAVDSCPQMRSGNYAINYVTSNNRRHLGDRFECRRKCFFYLVIFKLDL